ncbi:MAG: hypothetical protein Q4E34_00440 [Synergistaceae bacterium]|nr:hypothetical protein [Synergistaceae bacterium]
MRMKKTAAILLAAVFASVCVLSAGFAAEKTPKVKESKQTKQLRSNFQSVMHRWIRSSDKKYEEGSQTSYVEVQAVYFSPDYIEAHVQDQAQKNLWTQQEMEDYKYKYLQTLQLDKMIPFLVYIDNSASSMHMAPFDNIVKMRIGGKTYKAVDYDKRFNFRLMGEIEGLVFFPRYDEKTGKPLLSENGGTVQLEFNSFMSPILRNNITLIWSVGKEDINRLYAGKTAARLESDRLVERLGRLKKDKEALDAKAGTIQQEINTIQKRLDDLQKNM